MTLPTRNGQEPENHNTMLSEIKQAEKTNAIRYLLHVESKK